MKYLYLEFLLIIIFVSVKPKPCYSQELSHKYLISISAGAPKAATGSTFLTYWYTMVDISLSGLKNTFRTFYSGIGIDYSGFYPDEWLHLRSRLHIINPNVILRYNIRMLRKLEFSPEASFGYSWFNFTNRITPPELVRKYNFSGWSTKAGIDIDYMLREKFSLGLKGSYKNIFRSFGKEPMVLYDERKEDKYTGYLIVSISFAARF